MATFVGGILSPIALAEEHNKNQLPEMGSAGFSSLSIEKERQIGDVMMRHIRASQPLLNDPVLTEYINHLGNDLVKHANGVNYSFKFFLIKNQELNAFAFFGGHVGIHSGLVTTADTESELASVIAHEISHVTQRHLARRLESQSKNQPLTTAGLVSSILLTLINPTVGMAALSTTVALGQQMSINYTRGNEKEADRVGIALLAQSGYDPQGAPNFFGKMSERYRYTSKPPAMLLTHPLPESRITDARMRAQSFKDIKVAPSLTFELAKARIKARYENSPKENIAYFKRILKNKSYVYKEAALYGLANAFLNSKNYKDAEEILVELMAKAPKNLFYADVLTDVYISLNKYEKATRMLADLNSLMPNNQIITLNYANLLHKKGDNETAAQLLRDFLIVQPEHYIAHDLLTSIYKTMKKMDLMHATKAEIYAILGSYPRAIDQLQTAYNFATDNPLLQKRFKARILQFQEKQEKIKRL